MESKKNTKLLILLLLFCAVIGISSVWFLNSFSKAESARLHPVAGLLDLKTWEPEKDGVLDLNGQWDFYWNRFLSYQEVVSDKFQVDGTADVPSVWSKYKVSGKNLPGFGYATYALKVINAPVGKALALKMPTFSSAYKIYIDERLAASSGKIGTSKEQHSPGYQPQTVELTPDVQSFEIILHVSNYSHAQGGMCYTVQLGTEEQMRSMEKAISDRDLILFGALAIMAFYYLCVFLLQREVKSNLYFSLICILLATMSAISGDFLICRLIPFISFEAIIAIYYIILCCFPVCAAFIISELFPEKNSKKFLKAYFIYAVSMSLLILLTPVFVYTGLAFIINATSFVIGAYCVYTLSAAVLKGRKDAFIVLLGAMILISCMFHDMLFGSDTSKLAYFTLLLIQPFVLARRFSEMYKNINALSHKLLRLDKIKDEFLANTSHELRTPLNGILGITEAMLKGSDGELSGSQRQNLSLIAGSSRRLANLVNDILDYSKMKNGDIRLSIKPICIEGMILNVVNVFRHLSESKEYEVISEIQQELPPAMADENRTVQILYNLVGNAVKFTVRGCIKISARRAGDMLEICVSDTGVGIPEDKLEDIFKPFEQVDNSLTRKFGGTGLGLPITKHLVELQGGSIHVESRPGAGSIFCFTLPAAVGASLAEKEMNMLVTERVAIGREEVATGLDMAGNGASILLVDDDVVNLKAAVAVLRLGGYSVTAASSGEAALREIGKQGDYALVILDVMMPELSGYEVCRKLRENRPKFDLPVLMLTAKASIDDIIMGFESGANDYLAKPFEPEELLARVRTLVDLKISVDKAMIAEVAFLQSQIKPHFLFNTLNAISSFCDTDPYRAQKLIDDFFNYLRQSFDFKTPENFVPLERELSLANSYVEIEKARFGESLRVVFEIDKTIKIRVPMLSIQPLVENAVMHGLRKKGGGGTITVSVKKTDEGVRISVEDDGQGIPEEKLAILLISETGRGIGLWNIDKRLKKLFGSGLKIESSLGKGTRVAYTIPTEVF